MDSNESFDPITEVVGFSVKVAGRSISCRVTRDWLEDTFGAAALDEGVMKVFACSRQAIEAGALRTWLSSQGAEPISLKRDHVWRQPSSAGAAVSPG